MTIAEPLPTDMPAIDQARAAIAAKFPQPYHQRAILSGAWDAGQLIRDELALLGEKGSST